MYSTEQQIAQLEAQIARQEAEIRQLEAEIASLQNELAGFERRYDQVVKVAADKVEAAKAAIRDLKHRRYQRRMGYEGSGDNRWSGSASGAFDSFRYVPPPPDMDDLAGSAPKSAGSSDLKRLYRTLARRYHPDFALDDADRAHRNQLMAMINEAYANGDLDALRALLDAPHHHPTAAATSELPLAILKLRRLQETSFDLAGRIEDLKSERDSLLHSDMMDFKIEARLARSQGRDVLRELAADLEAEYRSLMRELEQLRREP